MNRNSVRASDNSRLMKRRVARREVPPLTPLRLSTRDASSDAGRASSLLCARRLACVARARTQRAAQPGPRERLAKQTHGLLRDEDRHQVGPSTRYGPLWATRRRVGVPGHHPKRCARCKPQWRTWPGLSPSARTCASRVWPRRLVASHDGARHHSGLRGGARRCAGCRVGACPGILAMVRVVASMGLSPAATVDGTEAPR